MSLADIVNDKTYKFNRYIPSNLYELSVLALLLGMYLPNRLHAIYEELDSAMCILINFM